MLRWSRVRLYLSILTCEGLFATLRERVQFAPPLPRPKATDGARRPDACPAPLLRLRRGDARPFHLQRRRGHGRRNRGGGEPGRAGFSRLVRPFQLAGPRRRQRRLARADPGAHRHRDHDRRRAPAGARRSPTASCPRPHDAEPPRPPSRTAAAWGLSPCPAT